MRQGVAPRPVCFPAGKVTTTLPVLTTRRPDVAGTSTRQRRVQHDAPLSVIARRLLPDPAGTTFAMPPLDLPLTAEAGQSGVRQNRPFRGSAMRTVTLQADDR